MVGGDATARYFQFKELLTFILGTAILGSQCQRASMSHLLRQLILGFTSKFLAILITLPDFMTISSNGPDGASVRYMHQIFDAFWKRPARTGRAQRILEVSARIYQGIVELGNSGIAASEVAACNLCPLKLRGLPGDSANCEYSSGPTRA